MAEQVARERTRLLVQAASEAPDHAVADRRFAVTFSRMKPEPNPPHVFPEGEYVCERCGKSMREIFSSQENGCTE